MCHAIVAALANPDSNRAEMNPPAGLNDVVIDRDVAGALGQVRPDTAFANPHAARAEIVQPGMRQTAILTAAPKPDAITSHVTDLAIFDDNVFCAIRHDNGGNAGL